MRIPLACLLLVSLCSFDSTVHAVDTGNSPKQTTSEASVPGIIGRVKIKDGKISITVVEKDTDIDGFINFYKECEREFSGKPESVTLLFSSDAPISAVLHCSRAMEQAKLIPLRIFVAPESDMSGKSTSPYLWTQLLVREPAKSIEPVIKK